MSAPRPTQEEYARRQRVWRHNSFLGHATMMMANTQAIILAETTTDESKEIARQIYALAADLRHSLRERRS